MVELNPHFDDYDLEFFLFIFNFAVYGLKNELCESFYCTPLLGRIFMDLSRPTDSYLAVTLKF